MLWGGFMVPELPVRTVLPDWKLGAIHNGLTLLKFFCIEEMREPSGEHREPSTEFIVILLSYQERDTSL